MRIRSALIISFALLFSLAAIGVGQAAQIAPAGSLVLFPSDDANARLSAPTSVSNIDRLLVRADITGACTPNTVPYLKFNLQGIPSGETIAGATLVLHVSSLADGTMDMALYGSLDDSWSETTLVWGNPPSRPLLDKSIELGSAPTAASGTVEFSSSALTAFLKSQMGGSATLGIEPKGNCDGTAQASQFFWSKDNGQSSSLNPTLNLTTQPLAVTMSTFRSADPAVNWPLIAGLGALAAAVIGGLAVARRRATTH